MESGSNADGYAKHADRARAIGQGALVVIGALLVATAITQPVSQLLVDAGVVAAGSPMETVAQTVLQFLGFLIAVGGYVLVTADRSLIEFDRPDRRDAITVLAGTAVLLALQFSALFVFGLLGISTGENQALLPGRADPTYFLYMIVVSVVLVGPGEELLFRGTVQGLLRRAWGVWPSILIASVVFGVIHIPGIVGAPSEALMYALVATGLGCVLGYLYERTGNVIVPSLIHGLYNATIYAMQYATHAG